jgi:nitrate reductase NapD
MMNPNNECHIASLLLHTAPGMADAVAQAIAPISIAEVVAVSEAGKLVILLETEDETLLHTTMDQFRMVEHVLSVALVYHQIDDDSAEHEQSTDQPIH